MGTMMPGSWQVSAAVLRSPTAYGALLSLEPRYGYPREVTVEVDRRLSRLLERRSRQGKRPPPGLEAEKLVLRIARKVEASAMAVLAGLAPKLDVPELRGLLGLPGQRLEGCR
jgi:hypothetical protein